MKKVLFIVYQSPGGAIWVNETLRSAFGMYGEDLEPAILLMQDSVIALNKNTHPENLGLLSLTMTFKYLERYGTPVYAVKEDLEEKKIKDEDIEPTWKAQILKKDELPDFVHSFDKVIVF
ncbi:MAG: DsrE family protein [Candidatus Atribacteria bacterium]|nr:DsrE family protein [Candidatus Atribacteria bacterium]